MTPVAYPNAPIPFSKLTQSILKKERIPHLVRDSEISVNGDESERFANLFHKETRRPMLRGVLNPEEADSLDLVQRIVTLIAGDDAGRGQKLCFSVPAAPLGADAEVNQHEAELKQMLGKLRYDARGSPKVSPLSTANWRIPITPVSASVAAVGCAIFAWRIFRSRFSASAFPRPATLSTPALPTCAASQPRASTASRRSRFILSGTSPTRFTWRWPRTTKT